jgi:hypothetical protein
MAGLAAPLRFNMVMEQIARSLTRFAFVLLCCAAAQNVAAQS